jgi:hypothetical protein
MGRPVLYMSMSLDGFIAGPRDTKDNPFGTKGHRLHEWLGDGGEDPSGRRLFNALGPGHIGLELVRVLDAPGVMHLRRRVQGAR